ncbi:hypothetical protein BS78_06G016700 [Paspalum vaginatum]|nr:hypothetical protein BS78_06G016700 [Paspalum vaginatum]
MLPKFFSDLELETHPKALIKRHLTKTWPHFLLSTVFTRSSITPSLLPSGHWINGSPVSSPTRTDPTYDELDAATQRSDRWTWRTWNGWMESGPGGRMIKRRKGAEVWMENI